MLPQFMQHFRFQSIRCIILKILQKYAVFQNAAPIHAAFQNGAPIHALFQNTAPINVAFQNAVPIHAAFQDAAQFMHHFSFHRNR